MGRGPRAPNLRDMSTTALRPAAAPTALPRPRVATPTAPAVREAAAVAVPAAPIVIDSTDALLARQEQELLGIIKIMATGLTVVTLLFMIVMATGLVADVPRFT